MIRTKNLEQFQVGEPIKKTICRNEIYHFYKFLAHKISK